MCHHDFDVAQSAVKVTKQNAGHHISMSKSDLLFMSRVAVLTLVDSASSADSLTVSMQPPVCNHMHQQLCPCEKSQTLVAISLFGHAENIGHNDRNG